MEFSISTNDYSTAELKKLAHELKSGEIFASWMVNGLDSEQLKMVFVPLNQQPLKPVLSTYTPAESENVVHVFQYFKESFFTKPNGYPSFNTCFGLKQKYVKPLMSELLLLES